LAQYDFAGVLMPVAMGKVRASPRADFPNSASGIGSGWALRR
jgi:hypothetical protein